MNTGEKIMFYLYGMMAGIAIMRLLIRLGLVIL